MNNLRGALVLILLTGFASSCATDAGNSGGGGTVEVNYQSPDQFTDMSRSYSALRGADEGYLSELREYIQRTGSHRLPARFALSITITDVDMAGQFEPERGPQAIDVRIVKAIYPPRIDLRFRLTDPSGAVRAQGERHLTNQSFQWTATPVIRDDPLRYEKALIDDFLREIASLAK